MAVSFFDLYAAPLTTGSEKALLHAHLQLHRDALLWKLEGLGESELRRPMTGTGTNLLGLVKHLTGVEGAYFCDAFGRPRPPLAWEDDEDAAMGEFSDMFAAAWSSRGAELRHEVGRRGGEVEPGRIPHERDVFLLRAGGSE